MRTSSVQSETVTARAARAMADRALHHARSTGRPHIATGTFAGTWLGDRGVFVNVCVALAEPGDWDDIVRAVDEVVPRGVPATIISPYPAPDLSGRGWHPMGHPPLMQRRQGAASAPVVPAELQIHEIVDAAGLEVFERTLVDAYPIPDLQPYLWGRFLDERVLGGATRLWLGFVDGRPVATAAAHVHAGFNAVEMIATLDGFRGRGYGAAVTWAATTADPSLPAVLIASDLGRPVYERLGYTVVERWSMWLRP